MTVITRRLCLFRLLTSAMWVVEILSRFCLEIVWCLHDRVCHSGYEAFGLARVVPIDGDSSASTFESLSTTMRQRVKLRCMDCAN